VGIAESRIAALRRGAPRRGVTIVERGGDAGVSAPAPLSLLDLPEETARACRAGGSARSASWPRCHAGLFERLGGDGVRVQRLARGEDPRPLVSLRPVPLFEESAVFEWGIETLEPVVERLRELAARVCARSARPGSRRRVRVDLSPRRRPRPRGRAHARGAHHRCRFGRRTAPAGARSAPPARGGGGAHVPRPAGAARARAGVAHRSLAPGSAPAHRHLESPGRAGWAPTPSAAPALLDTHRPDAVASPPIRLTPPHRPLPPGRGSRLALRRLRPPAPASVTLASGRPVAVRSGRLTGRIVAGVGPWRVSGEWWSPRPWLQDEWDVELADGHALPPGPRRLPPGASKASTTSAPRRD